jgi:hypothetical protein
MTLRRRRLAILGPLGLVVSLAACGGGGDSGFAIGGSTMCGEVAPCGGDLAGTWVFGTGCLTAAGLKDAESGEVICSSGESISITSIDVSGSATFNADMTYTLALTEQAAARLSLSQSCLQGHTCGELQTALENTGDFASVSCSTSGACSCDATQPTNTAGESGTYTLSGSTVTTTSSTGVVSAIPYCVQGTEIHLLDTSTMNLGAMGLAAVDEDTVGTKQ